MKNYRFLLIIIASSFLFLGNVFAEEDNTCNAVNFNKLRTQASNIRVSYIPDEIVKLTDPDAETGATTVTRNILDIKIYNITSNMYVKVVSSGANISKDEHIITLDDVAPDGSATIRQPAQKEPITYEFTVYSDSYGCSTRVLRTFKMTLPRYNSYSELEACEEIPEFYLCQKYTTFAVDGETFYNRVDDYKSKLTNQVEDSDGIDSEDNNLLSGTISAVSKNKYIIVGIIVAIGVILTILILRKKRSV